VTGSENGGYGECLEDVLRDALVRVRAQAEWARGVIRQLEEELLGARDTLRGALYAEKVIGGLCEDPYRLEEEGVTVGNVEILSSGTVGNVSPVMTVESRIQRFGDGRRSPAQLVELRERIMAVIREMWGDGAPAEITARDVWRRADFRLNDIYSSLRRLEKAGLVRLESRKDPGAGLYNAILPPKEKVAEVEKVAPPPIIRKETKEAPRVSVEPQKKAPVADHDRFMNPCDPRKDYRAILREDPEICLSERRRPKPGRNVTAEILGDPRPRA